jgi:uncharacterized protein
MVLIIPGSGLTDRDANNRYGVTGSTQRLLADAPAQHSIGTVRVESRGMFGSRAAMDCRHRRRLRRRPLDLAAWTAKGGLVALAAVQKLAEFCGSSPPLAGRP